MEKDPTRQLALFIRRGLLHVVRDVERMYGLRRAE
jgi:hypothetical protein